MEIALGKGLFISIKGHLCLTKEHFRKGLHSTCFKGIVIHQLYLFRRIISE